MIRFWSLTDPLLFYHKKLVIYSVNMNNKGSWMIIFISLSHIMYYVLYIYMIDDIIISWTVIQWELYPIPSALGSQISSGLVSSTVGDHVRSPGTVRFVFHSSSLHVNLFYSSFILLFHSFSLLLIPSRDIPLQTFSLFFFSSPTQNYRTLLSRNILRKDWNSSQLLECGSAVCPINQKRENLAERRNEIHQDMSQRHLYQHNQQPIWTSDDHWPWILQTGSLISLSLSFTTPLSHCSSIYSQNLFTQQSDLRISRNTSLLYMKERCLSNGFPGDFHTFNLINHQDHFLWFWSIISKIYPWILNRMIILC